MAHDDDPRPHGARCGARTRSGGRCGHPPMEGQRRCRHHGGSSPQAKQAARRRLERERVSAAIRRLGIPVEGDADPLAILARVLNLAAGDLETLRDAVAEVEVHDPDHPVVSMYLEAVDRAGRLAKVAADTSLAERMASIAEADARALRDALDRAMGVVGLDLNQRLRLGQALAAELRGHTVQQIGPGEVSE